MKLKFDGNQEFQREAIASVVDLFDGSNPMAADWSVRASGELSIVANRTVLPKEDLLHNLREVQIRNGLEPDDTLKLVTESVNVGEESRQWSFANFSVEMETGTGKTYVYLRTALDLYSRYGLSKFIVVVPTIAIRQGVLTMLRVTRDHFAALYPDVRYHAHTYDSDNLGDTRQFAQSPCVEFMIMTIASFNKSTNVIYRRADRLQGDAAISIVQATRPILILDEPQNMGSELAMQSLAGLTPLFALRYSATHRDPYNLVYRLTPLEAYRSGLVKQIEVAGVERETDANRPFLRLVSIKATKRRCSARLAVHVLRATGGVRERQLTVYPGTDLEAETERPEYSGFVVDEVNPVTNTLRFNNNMELAVGESEGGDRTAIFESQIRYTIREHLLRQRRLRARGIKVLSLFFVDRVSNYAGDQPIIQELFDSAFDELKKDFSAWKNSKASDVRAAYFASQRRRGGHVDLLDTNRSAATDNDKKAFQLIMNDKERLLKFDESVAFVFSHSALREGWDNPNVCQICTLNQSVSEMRKRQELGRGMRLVVDQKGHRVTARKYNVLTVVANESYERYVGRYQQEIAEDLGATGVGNVPVNARRRREVRLRRTVAQSGAFVKLWDRVRRKTRYSLRIDTEALLAAVVPALDQVGIQPVRVRVAKGRVVPQGDGFAHQVLSGARTMDRADAEGTVERLIETTLHLLEHGSQPCRITRRTLLEVFLRTKTKKAALANPHEWATVTARILREQIADQLIQNISYEVVDQSYSLELFDDVVESWEDLVVESNLGLYDHVVVDSKIERAFVQDLESDSRTKAYAKLPKWYKVETPVGAYNPDWAIARRDQDEHGQGLGNAYLVAETKGTLSQEALRPLERRKISCGEAHFGVLGVRFEVARTLADAELEESSSTRPRQ